MRIDGGHLLIDEPSLDDDLLSLGDDLRAGAKPPVLLAGSLISSYAPTGIPNGIVMSKRIFRMLFAENETVGSCLSAGDMALVQNVFCPDWRLGGLYGDGMPFEMLFENRGNCDDVKHVFYDYFRERQPNTLHRAIARWLHAGIIGAVITPNYDRCIESAYEALYGPGGLRAIYEEKQVTKETGDQKICFHIHGSVQSADARQLCVVTSDEKQMDPWKKDLLARITGERDLIVIGYSGKDFEICPVLYELSKSGRCGRIVYNNLYPAVTYNMRLLLDAKADVPADRRNMLAVGDVLRFVNALFRSDIRASLGGDSLADELYGSLSAIVKKDRWAADLWVYRLLVYMGCVRQAQKMEPAMAPPSASLRRDYLTVKAGRAYKAGRYQTSAALYRRVIREGKAFQPASARLELVCDCLESYRAGYFLMRAALCYGRAFAIRRLGRKDIQKEGQNASLMLSYRFMMLLKNIFILTGLKSRTVSKTIVGHYARGCRNAVQTGNRVLLQNYALELMSMEALIHPDDMRAVASRIGDEAFGSVKSRGFGYEELGTVFELLIYRRREVMNRYGVGRNRTARRLSAEDRDYVLKLAEVALECGIDPEAYKCLILAGAGAVPGGADAADVSTLLARCEYARVFRIKAYFLLRRIRKEAAAGSGRIVSH